MCWKNGPTGENEVHFKNKGNKLYRILISFVLGINQPIKNC